MLCLTTSRQAPASVGAVAFRLVVKQQLTLARCAESHSFAALS